MSLVQIELWSIENYLLIRKNWRIIKTDSCELFLSIMLFYFSKIQDGIKLIQNWYEHFE